MFSQVSKIVVGSLVAVTALVTQATTPSELAPYIPEDAMGVIHIDLERSLKLPFVQINKLKLELEENLNKANLDPADIKTMTLAFRGDAHFAYYIETPLETKTLLAKIEAAGKDSGFSQETIKINGATVYRITSSAGAISISADTTTQTTTFYIQELRPGLLLLTEKKHTQWAITPAKKLTSNAPVITAIPGKNIARAVSWFGIAPDSTFATSVEQFIAAHNLKDNPVLSLFPDFTKFNSAGGVFFQDREDYVSLFKINFENEEEAPKLKRIIALGITGLGAHISDSALLHRLQKTLIVRTAKNACGITLRFNDALIEEFKAATANKTENYNAISDEE